MQPIPYLPTHIINRGVATRVAMCSVQEEDEVVKPKPLPPARYNTAFGYVVTCLSSFGKVCMKCGAPAVTIGRTKDPFCRQVLSAAILRNELSVCEQGLLQRILHAPISSNFWKSQSCAPGRAGTLVNIHIN